MKASLRHFIFASAIVAPRFLAAQQPAENTMTTTQFYAFGDSASAYGSLRDFAEMGMTRRIDKDTTLAGLHGSDQWNAVMAQISRNGGGDRHS